MKIKNLTKKQNGQSLVEAAIIIPIIILLLCGIIDFGLLFNNYIVISNASREGARRAAVGDDDSEIISYIANYTSSMDQTKLTISIIPVYSQRNEGDDVTVTVSYQNSILTPFISNILPNPVNLSSSTVMRVE